MIPQIEPWIDDTELYYLKKVIDSTFITEHKLTNEFETKTKELTGAKNAIAMCNGTAALFCALKALNIGQNDKVIVPDITFIASANAIILAGAEPIFCDIKEDTFCIDISYAEKLIDKNVKAIMPVHLFGQSADMEEVINFAKKYNLYLIEDAAQGIGVKFNNKHVGTFGDIGVLSYYGNKTITCGEGGMILTNNDELAMKCYRLKNHGRDKKGIFIHEEIGYNFSFTEMQAAVGLAQMEKLNKIIEKKKYIHDIYAEKLKDVQQLKFVFIDPRCEPVFWFTSFLAENVNELSDFLYKKGIQTRRFFYPLHLQKCYFGKFNSDSSFPVSEKIYNLGISLPSSYSLKSDEQEYVIESIKEFYSK